MLPHPLGSSLITCLPLIPDIHKGLYAGGIRHSSTRTTSKFLNQMGSARTPKNCDQIACVLDGLLHTLRRRQALNLRVAHMLIFPGNLGQKWAAIKNLTLSALSRFEKWDNLGSSPKI